MEKIKTSQNLIKLAKIFSPAPLYAVGGFVRCALLGCTPGDTDICSPLNAEDVQKLLENTPFIITAAYNKLGTLRICDNEGNPYEYTAFRKESYSGGGLHRPENVEFGGSLYEDAKRRDFTVNAIYYDIFNGQLIDPLGGIGDLKAKILRAADDPEKVFSSDGLRLLRMVRFACETGFDIDEKTFAAAEKNYLLLKDIKSERIFEELEKILCSDRKYPLLTENGFPHYRGIRLLKQLNLLPLILPGIELSYNIGQREDFHKYDVFEHIAQTVKFSHKSIRLAALLHDIGKGICYKSQGNFHNHENVGAAAAEKLLGQSGLKCPKKLINETSFLIKYHMYDLNCQTSENKVKWFIAENYAMMPKLLLLKQADYLGCGLKSGISPTVSRWEKIINAMECEGSPFSLKGLNVSGRDIIGIGCPEPLISEVLRQLHKNCVINPKQNEKNKLLYMAENIVKSLKGREGI